MCGRPPGDDVRAWGMVAFSNDESPGDIPRPILSVAAPSFGILLASIHTPHQPNNAEWWLDEALLDEEALKCRASLQSVLRNSAVTCIPVEEPDTVDTEIFTPKATCLISLSLLVNDRRDAELTT